MPYRFSPPNPNPSASKSKSLKMTDLSKGNTDDGKGNTHDGKGNTHDKGDKKEEEKLQINNKNYFNKINKIN